MAEDEQQKNSYNENIFRSQTQSVARRLLKLGVHAYIHNLTATVVLANNWWLEYHKGSCNVPLVIIIIVIIIVIIGSNSHSLCLVFFNGVRLLNLSGKLRTAKVWGVWSVGCLECAVTAWTFK